VPITISEVFMKQTPTVNRPTIALLCFGLSFITLSLALAATLSLSLSINGRTSPSKALVIDGQTYIPLAALEAAGVKSQRSGNSIALTLTNAATGGSNERLSLEGCLGEQLFNGVWRLRASKLEAIQKDGNTPGWSLLVELRNGSKATIMPVDAGISGSGEGIQLAFADASTLNVDGMDVQKLTFASMPAGGAVSWPLKFYYPFGTAQTSIKTPNKFLLEVNPKGIGDSTRAKGVAFTSASPSFRIKLDCQK
jgi:hypothetical protein